MAIGLPIALRRYGWAGQPIVDMLPLRVFVETHTRPTAALFAKASPQVEMLNDLGM